VPQLTLSHQGMRRTFQDLARGAGLREEVRKRICGHITDEMKERYSTVGQGEQVLDVMDFRTRPPPWVRIRVCRVPKWVCRTKKKNQPGALTNRLFLLIFFGAGDGIRTRDIKLGNVIGTCFQDVTARFLK